MEAGGWGGESLLDGVIYEKGRVKVVTTEHDGYEGKALQ